MDDEAEPPENLRQANGNWIKWIKYFISALRVAVALILAPAVGVAAEAVEQARTPPRLSLVDGDVSFWRQGADDWAAARINVPLAPGDYLYTGPDGRLELQVAAQGYLRASAETELALYDQENSTTRFGVRAGDVSLDLRSQPQGERFVIEAPSASFEIDRPGYYRVIVDGERTAFIVRQDGRATVMPANESPTVLASGEQVVLNGTHGGHISVATAPPTDDWDRWNYERTAEVSSPASARYVSNGMYGTDSLDRYGRWRSTSNYGWVWVPQGVAPGWAPYSAGWWARDPYYGWSWVDDAPWGWAPYHYGRWVYLNSYWAWAPGPVFVAPVYAPALVAFFGGGSFSVGVGFGVPYVSWVALGWGEPLIPWWGGFGFYGRPCWRGWGGPRVVNNVVINNTTIINANHVHKYQNLGVHDALVAVRREQFGRSAIARSRITHVNTGDFRPIHGSPPVESGIKGLVEAAGRGRRPPQTLRGQSTDVARRPDRDQVPRGMRVSRGQGAGGETQTAGRGVDAAARPQTPQERAGGYAGARTQAIGRGDSSARPLRDRTANPGTGVASAEPVGSGRSLPPPLPQGRRDWSAADQTQSSRHSIQNGGVATPSRSFQRRDSQPDRSVRSESGRPNWPEPPARPGISTSAGNA